MTGVVAWEAEENFPWGEINTSSVFTPISRLWLYYTSPSPTRCAAPMLKLRRLFPFRSGTIRVVLQGPVRSRSSRKFSEDWGPRTGQDRL